GGELSPPRRWGRGAWCRRHPVWWETSPRRRRPASKTWSRTPGDLASALPAGRCGNRLHQCRATRLSRRSLRPTDAAGARQRSAQQEEWPRESPQPPELWCGPRRTAPARAHSRRPISAPAADLENDPVTGDVVLNAHEEPRAGGIEDSPRPL